MVDSLLTKPNPFTNLCLSEDEFTEEQKDKKQARWVAQLSSGEIVFQDDNRPGLLEPSAWKRLKSFLQHQSIYISKLWVEFRSHKEYFLPENADGYFFSKCLIGFLTGGEQLDFYLLGYLKSDIVTVYKWKVPELILIEIENRNTSKCNEGMICQTGKLAK